MSATPRRRRTRHIVAGTLVGSLAIAFAATAPALAGEPFNPPQDDPICEEETFQQLGSLSQLDDRCVDPKDPKDPKDPEDPKDPKYPDDQKDPPVDPPVEPPLPPLIQPPPVVPPTADPTVETPVSPVVKRANPRLTLTKRGQKRTRSGNVASWRIQVTNRGHGIARGVVLRDLVPNGFALTRSRVRVGSGRKAKWVRLRYRIARGNVVWNLGNLRRGQRRTILVSMRSTATAAGRRCNLALLTARNHRSLRARACVSIRQIRTKVLPAVTG